MASKTIVTANRKSSKVVGFMPPTTEPRTNGMTKVVESVEVRARNQPTHLSFFIADTLLEIRSPGILPNSVTLDNIRTHYSKPRNESIARVLLNLGFANRLGSGIPRMIRLMRDHVGRDPEFEVNNAQCLVRLWSII